MGNKNCERVQSQLQQNQAYGEYQIVKEGNINHAKVLKVFQTKSGLQKSIQASLKKRKQLRSQGLCKLKAFEIQQSQSICQIVLKYEYYSNSLFHKRQLIFGQEEYFSLDQLMKIIDSVSEALNELYRNKIKHGCINFNTILCTQNSYKITDVSTTTYLTSLQLVIKGSNNQPLSKRLIDLFNSSQINQQSIKKIKKTITLEDDLFSLGMIILSLATKIQISQFYKFASEQQRLFISFKDELIEDYLYLLKKRYNKKLEKIVRTLISPKKQLNQHSISRFNCKKDRNQLETNQNSIFSVDISDLYS